MTIQEAYAELWAKVPEATRIDVSVDLVCKRGQKPTAEYTVAVFDGKRHSQVSCVPSLELAVHGVLAEIGGEPFSADLSDLQSQLSGLQL